MIVEVKREVCDGHMLKWLVAAALAWLEHHREYVNQLNVFPVPDGDTGTNMWLTMQKAYGFISRQEESHVGIVAQNLAQGALHGARGNSGVILSQLIKGFASVIYEKSTFDTSTLAIACQAAVNEAYKAVQEPTEGTILTVARLTADAVTTYAQKHNDLQDALDVMLQAAQDALEQTPDLLPILKKAGVVDSGGAGLVYILEGMSRMLHGEPVYMDENPKIELNSPLQVAPAPEDEHGYGYDVQFLMRGQALNLSHVRQIIEQMGWSALVVGDDRLIKVHVHVHDPGKPLSYAVKSGAVIEDIVVENMQVQYENYMEQRLKNDEFLATKVDGIGIVTVTTGAGFRKLFLDELQATYVVSGGQTMNPSAEDFVKAINRLGNSQVIILPNNRNVVMAAQQAANMIDNKTIRVINTTTIPQGINAMLTYLNTPDSNDMDFIVQEMQKSAALIVTIEITRAVRDSHINGISIQRNQFIGLVDNDLISVGETLETVVIDALMKAGADERELITLYYGDSLTKKTVQAIVDSLSPQFSKQNFEVVNGGQPLYPLVISLE